MPASAVRPILGVVPISTDTPTEIHRDKKIKFRFFRSTKEESFAKHLRETNLIVARIK
jgi:hypothetical protein